MDDKTKIYPYCYKIMDDCPPCNIKSGDNCIRQLAYYLALKTNRYVSKNDLDKAHIKVGNCLKKNGDIYKKLGIELYVNPKTKQIIFPNYQRVLSNYNLFLNELGTTSPASPKDDNIRDEKIILYQILLDEKLREVYNEFYQSYGFSELESIMPKEYGIARLMGPPAKEGGKRNKKTKRRRRIRKTKRRIYKKLI